MRFQSLGLACAATVFGLLACDSGTAPDAGITQADVNQLANDVDALSVVALGDAGASAFSPSFNVITSAPSGAPISAAVVPVNRTFTNTHPCPAGGTVTISGSSVGTSDPVAHNLSVTTTATKTDAACAFNARNGVLTLTGNPNVALVTTVNIVAGKPVGPQTQSHKGSVSWARGTKSGTCNVDVTSTFDPTAATFTVTGTMCGRTVNVSRTAPAGSIRRRRAPVTPRPRRDSRAFFCSRAILEPGLWN
jgi:hypothetical protein